MGVGALAAGISGWLVCKTTWVERPILLSAGLILVYPSPAADVLRVGLVGAVALWQRWTKKQDLGGKLRSSARQS